MLPEGHAQQAHQPVAVAGAAYGHLLLLPLAGGANSSNDTGMPCDSTCSLGVSSRIAMAATVPGRCSTKSP